MIMNAKPPPIDKMQSREVIFEFRPVGGIMRVSAMDTATMTEITIQCPLTAGEAVFQKNALLRLAYVLDKRGLLS
ncbi:MAG: hypothetical protein OXT65_02105 [Alphaproteobacteria bacterium]|nr:hypothetical protein [Alphaproteobacteria bacterium]